MIFIKTYSVSTNIKHHEQQRCTYKHLIVLFHMESSSFRVIAPDSPDNKTLYRKLAQDYWNWVQSENPDSEPRNPKDPSVTFLRDDIIGPQLVHEVGIARGSQKREERHENENISVKTGEKIFFPIYHVLSAEKHPYVMGGECDNPGKRKDAANKDLDNCFEKWAKIDGADIVDKDTLENHYIDAGEFDLHVPSPNDLNREAGFNLPPGTWKSFAAGTYMCLEPLQAGTYTIDFGGRATDFHSISKYKVKVTSP
jgi:hypothetical protein